MSDLTIRKRNNCYIVDECSGAGRKITIGFVKNFIEYTFIKSRHGKGHWAPLRTFGASDLNRTEFRLHINTLDGFLSELKLNGITNYKVIDETNAYKPIKYNFNLASHWHPRELQLEPIEYLADPNYKKQVPKVNSGGWVMPTYRKLLTLRTGGGKTSCSIFAITRLKTRVMAIIRPGFFNNMWPDVFKDMLELTDADIFKVEGSAQLISLVKAAKAGTLTQPVIFISNKTMQSFITFYEHEGKKATIKKFGCLPDQLANITRSGVLLRDEVHLDAHLQFKIDMYVDIKHQMSLSATYIASSPFVTEMLAVMHPHNTRYISNEVSLHTTAIALLYNSGAQQWEVNKFRQGIYYSHDKFEEYILSKSKFTLKYFDVILAALERYYIKDLVPGSKAIIFVYSIDMANALLAHLIKLYPQLDIRRYVSTDPYENLIAPDIRISTIGKSGAASDIEGLTCNIMTTALKAEASNIQTLGRTRPRSGFELYFVWLTALDIPKQYNYYQEKLELLRGKVKELKEFEYFGDCVFK